MDKITVGKLFELYYDTLDKCGENVKELPDRLIENYIFEEVVIGITSFFHKKSLDRLLSAGIIDEEIYENSERLRKYLLSLEGTDFWNLSAVKRSKEWQAFFDLSCEIRGQLSNKWDEQEIKKLYEFR